MRSIREVLDEATPPDLVPPSALELRQRLRDRTRRRRSLAGAGVIAVVASVGFSVAAGVGGGQRIESGDQQPDPDVTESDLFQTTTTELSPATSTEAPRGETTEEARGEAWQSRWFLVPPAGTEVEIVQTQHAIWERAQGATFDRVVVTTDRSDPASAGLAWVYHLDGINMFRIGDPDGTYRETVVGDRQVRIGEESEDDRINTFTSSETGAFVVAGVGLTADQAVELVTAAQLVNGEVQFGDRLPIGLELVAQATSMPTDHLTTLAWGSDNDRFALQMAPTTVEDALAGRRYTVAESVSVRGTTGVALPASPVDTFPALVWSEDGYTMVLTEGDPLRPPETDEPSSAGDVDRLVEVADSLIRLDQPDLLERLDDPFMLDQATTVAGWLEATPTPTGWDTSPLVNSVPQDQLRLAGFVRQFLECTWLAEWDHAARAGDITRRSQAEAVLARESTWPVFLAEMEALREVISDEADPALDETRGLDQRTEQLGSAQTDNQLDDVQQRYGCGFNRPG